MNGHLENLGKKVSSLHGRPSFQLIALHLVSVFVDADQVAKLASAEPEFALQLFEAFGCRYLYLV